EQAVGGEKAEPRDRPVAEQEPPHGAEREPRQAGEEEEPQAEKRHGELHRSEEQERPGSEARAARNASCLKGWRPGRVRHRSRSRGRSRRVQRMRVLTPNVTSTVKRRPSRTITAGARCPGSERRRTNMKSLMSRISVPASSTRRSPRLSPAFSAPLPARTPPSRTPGRPSPA